MGGLPERGVIQNSGNGSCAGLNQRRWGFTSQRLLAKKDFPHLRTLAPLLADYDGKAESVRPRGRWIGKQSKAVIATGSSIGQALEMGPGISGSIRSMVKPGRKTESELEGIRLLSLVTPPGQDAPPWRSRA